MDAMTSLEGDTGPYLQYAHARLCSIKRRAALSEEDLDAADLTLLTESHATNVVRMLAQWPDVLKNALRTLEPTTILTYLFKTAHVVSSSYDQLQVVGSERELMRARMALYDAARIVLANGMRILGLTPLERSVSGSAPRWIGEPADSLLGCKFAVPHEASSPGGGKAMWQTGTGDAHGKMCGAAQSVFAARKPRRGGRAGAGVGSEWWGREMGRARPRAAEVRCSVCWAVTGLLVARKSLYNGGPHMHGGQAPRSAKGGRFYPRRKLL